MAFLYNVDRRRVNHFRRVTLTDRLFPHLYVIVAVLKGEMPWEAQFQAPCVLR